jgi:polysaccharide deacetylase family protein (PEP-CTERM system associated)
MIECAVHPLVFPRQKGFAREAISSMRHAFTVDAEDWPQLMCSYLGRETPASRQFTSSIANTLFLLDQWHIRATFFVVAPHAAERPEIVREIVARGHEVASHGVTHAKLHTFSPQKFRDDLHRSVETLEDITGEKVRGYRAPFFSLMPDQCWAWEVMLDCGLDYDSSLTTLLWQGEGVALPDRPFACDLPSGREIVEFPALARKIGPITGRLIGGRTLRMFPRSVARSHMDEREADGLPAMLYVHSYEVTPDRLMRYLPSGLSLRDRAKLFVSAKAFELGMKRMSRALGDLAHRYDWAPMCDVVDALRREDKLPRVAVESSGSVCPDVSTATA